jgi:hypothetical protein
MARRVVLLFLRVLCAWNTGGTTSLDARTGVISCSLCRVDILLLLGDHHRGGLVCETFAFGQSLSVPSVMAVVVRHSSEQDFGATFFEGYVMMTPLMMSF